VTCLGVAACGSSGTVGGAPAASSVAGASDQPTATGDPGAASPSDSTADPGPAAVDPCKLVTKDEAQKLIGTTLQDGVEAGQGSDAPSCTYSGDPNGPTAQVEVHTGAGAKKYYDLQRDALAHQMTAEAGIGDEAWIDKDDMSIFVRKGDTWFVIHMVSLDDVEKFIPGLKEAATTAVGRI
jgi:hypothetical protein